MSCCCASRRGEKQFGCIVDWHVLVRGFAFGRNTAFLAIASYGVLRGLLAYLPIHEAIWDTLSSFYVTTPLVMPLNCVHGLVLTIRLMIVLPVTVNYLARSLHRFGPGTNPVISLRWKT